MNNLKSFPCYLLRSLSKKTINQPCLALLSTNLERQGHPDIHNKNLIDPRRVSPLHVLKPKESLDFDAVHKELRPTFNLAAYANKSEVLQELTKLGAKVYKIEKNVELAEYILKLDFRKDIVPIIQFLHDNGVNPDDLGEVISRRPAILKESIDDLNVRINYLQSKKFTKEMITKIITECPLWLSNSVELTDSKLGFLQKTFKLNGDQVRAVASNLPKVVQIPNRDILATKFAFLEEMGFEEYEVKSIIVHNPIYLKFNTSGLVALFDYITKDMNIPKDLILKKSTIFYCKKFKLKERDQFLKFIGRAQYNPLMPGYVSLDDIAIEDDAEFCEKVAKTSVHTYNEFLKTLF